MSDLKYTLISSTRQYEKYCKILEELVFSGDKGKAIKNEIDLLTLLIEKYDEEHTHFRKMDPIQLIQSLMADRNMRNIDLARLLGVSEGLVSDMLNRKKGLSKETMRILANEFKISQDAFNQPYPIRLTSASKVDSPQAKKIQQPLLISEPPSDYGLEKQGKKKRKSLK
jgi:HTH-type transcriptional regulator/antitoxin HigA